MSQALSTAWLASSNLIVSVAWARVFFLIISHRDALYDGNNNDICQDVLIPATHTALYLSFVELLNSLIGLTRSKPIQVLTFNAVRMGVALWIAPKLPCHCWQTLITITCWSFGDTVRFGCFGIDTLLPGGRAAKNIRYTVAPLLFPVGALGEMLMVMRVGTATFCLFSLLWPVGFYPLMMQLLKQKQKHFSRDPGGKEKDIRSV